MTRLLLLTLTAAQAVPPAPSASPTKRPAPDGPRVVLETTRGSITVGLYKTLSPISVENFLRYVNARHYDGTIFHRVIPGFMIQGGGMDKDLVEKPTRPAIRNEARNGLRNRRGTLAMARTSDPDSATSQFFVNVKDNAMLDFGIGGAGYAVFGEVLEGMDVVDAIVAVPTRRRGGHENVPMSAVVIERARVLAAEAPQRAPAAGATAAPKAPSPSPTPSASIP